MRYKNELVGALLKEIELQRDHFKGELIETIYLGGGTPSLCSKTELDNIIQKIHATYKVSPGVEITLEANPDDIYDSQLDDWKETGINRLSIGIQSFFEEDLRWMNRAHNAQQALKGLGLAISKFDNITIDLIYGTPGLDNKKWKQNVDRAVALGVPHLSCYALTVEPKTPLDKLIRQHRLENVNPDLQSEQFLLLMQWLEKAGYEHYEISNFAKPGYRSRHNSSYWQGKKYLGIGPSAHSFDTDRRWWNISNNISYIRSVEQGIIPFEKEILTPVQQLNEYIMISLRTSEGLNFTRMAAEKATILKRKTAIFLEKGLLIDEGDFIRLTKEGKLLADGIAADLFFD